VDTIPKIEIFGPREVCMGHEATYVGLGAQSYLWNNGSTSPVTSYTISQDSFLIVLTGQSGVCPPARETLYVRAYEAPMIEIQPLTPIRQCFIGNQFQLTANLLPGSATPTGYIWFLGEQAIPAVVETQTTPLYTYKTPGEKHVWVVAKNAVCPSDTARITLYVMPHPKADFETPSPQCWYLNRFDFINTTTPLYPQMQFIWRFGSNAVPPTSNDVNPSGVFFLEPGTYPVELVAIDSVGCRDSITKTVIVHEHPDTPVVANPTVEICQYFNALLRVISPENVQILWFLSETDTVPVSRGYNFFTPPLPQTTTYWVASENAFGCQSLARIPVTVIVNPLPPLAIDPDTGQILLEIPNTEVQLTAVTDASVVAYEWNFGDGTQSTLPNPRHRYEKPGLYTVTLTVVDTNGCVSTIIRRDFVKVEEPIRVFIPNAFSPNGDGQNDVFFIVTNLVERIQLQIFDRWGNVIYETNDLNFRWDGYDYLRGEPCPEGAYPYYLKVELYDGRKLERQGTITLIR
jgi:gliding motility-associated-like protein